MLRAHQGKEREWRVNERLQTRPYAGSRGRRSPGCRSASATIKQRTEHCCVSVLRIGRWQWELALQASVTQSRRSAGSQRISIRGVLPRISRAGWLLPCVGWLRAHLHHDALLLGHDFLRPSTALYALPWQCFAATVTLLPDSARRGSCTRHRDVPLPRGLVRAVSSRRPAWSGAQTQATR